MLGLDMTEFIFSVAIAIIYPFFFSKLTTKILKYDETQDMCSKYDTIMYPYYTFYQPAQVSNPQSEEEKSKQIEADKCRQDMNVKLDDIKFKQHIMLIVIAFMGILATSVIQANSTKVGVGMGGILTLIVALTMYWHKYNETAKIGILGGSLLVLLFLSVRLYKVKNIVDIFSLIEYGSKA